MLLKQNFANSNTNVIQQENHSNADVTIPLATLNKLLEDVEELKDPKTDQWHYTPEIRTFCDSLVNTLTLEKSLETIMKQEFIHVLLHHNCCKRLVIRKLTKKLPMI